MNEDSIDLKERKPKGILQKFIDSENRLDNNDRKEQMKLALESERFISREVKNRENVIEKIIEKESPKVNSVQLAKEIKKEVDMER